MHLILLLPATMLGLLVLIACVRRPVATIVPVYAALVPVGDVFSLRVPLPQPFNSLSSVVGALTIVALVLHLVLERRGRVPTLPVWRRGSSGLGQKASPDTHILMMDRRRVLVSESVEEVIDAVIEYRRLIAGGGHLASAAALPA